jgi:hypothetical protein
VPLKIYYVKPTLTLQLPATFNNTIIIEVTSSIPVPRKQPRASAKGKKKDLERNVSEWI